MNEATTNKDGKFVPKNKRELKMFKQDLSKWNSLNPDIDLDNLF